MKKDSHDSWIFLFVLTLLPAQDALADWKVYYTGKAAKMFGPMAAGGSFRLESPMRIVPDVPSRVRVDELPLQRVRPPEAIRCPRADLSAAFRAIERSRIRRAGTAAGPGGARGETSAGGRGRQTARAGCRHGTGGRRAAAAAIRPGQRHPGRAICATA